jgi:hypothetical protein
MAAIQLYTIVDRRTSQPFLLRVRNRAAVVAFRTHTCAHLTARAIEQRESVMGTMAETYDLVPAPDSLVEPMHHYLQAWESFDSLAESCARDELDILCCAYVDAQPEESIEFIGSVYDLGGLTPP